MTRAVGLHWPQRLAVPPPTPDPGLHGRVQLPGQQADAPHARLIRGDALDVADRLLAEGLGGRVDLIHLDPPFGSEAGYMRLRELQTAAGPVDLRVPAYGDDDDLATWLEQLEPVLHRCHQLLSPRGALYLHLDFRRAPYARVLLDGLFGADHLCNEIVWAYGLGGSSDRRFQRKHDVLAFYARDLRQQWFAAPREAATSSRMRGQAKGATDVWRTEDRDDGTLIERDWPDTLLDKTLSNRDPERTGYPTQKPLALAARIVRASLPPGGLAVDLMSGSGTFGVAATLAGGRVILGDRGDLALDVGRGRLLRAGAHVTCEAIGAAPGLTPVPARVRIENRQVTLDDVQVPWPPTDLPEAPPLSPLDRLGAWGLCERTAAGLQAVAWWDAGADRNRPPVPRTLPLDRPPLFATWLGVDVTGRWFCCDL